MTEPTLPVRSHRDLLAWQRGMEIVVETYCLTATLPKTEVYGLSAQMRQAAISIPANIAEGQARRGTRDYLRFLGISQGSLRELQTYADVMLRLGYAEEPVVQKLKSLTEQTARLLGKLVVALSRRPQPDSLAIDSRRGGSSDPGSRTPDPVTRLATRRQDLRGLRAEPG